MLTLSPLQLYTFESRFLWTVKRKLGSNYCIIWILKKSQKCIYVCMYVWIHAEGSHTATCSAASYHYKAFIAVDTVLCWVTGYTYMYVNFIPWFKRPLGGLHIRERHKAQSCLEVALYFRTSLIEITELKFYCKKKKLFCTKLVTKLVHQLYGL